MVELEPATATVPGDATSMAELWQARLDGHDRFAAYGRVTRVVGLVLEATGIDVGLGSLCRITSHARDRSVLAEVLLCRIWKDNATDELPSVDRLNWAPAVPGCVPCVGKPLRFQAPEGSPS